MTEHAHRQTILSQVRQLIAQANGSLDQWMLTPAVPAKQGLELARQSNKQNRVLIGAFCLSTLNVMIATVLSS